MARIRTVKPEFWSDSKTGTLSDRATKIFIGLLNFSDDWGVHEYDLLSLKAKIYPYGKQSPEMLIGKSLCSELIPKGLVRIISHDGKKFLLIPQFKKHQRIDRPGRPVLPGFEKEAARAKYLNSTNIRRTFDEHSTNAR